LIITQGPYQMVAAFKFAWKPNRRSALTNI
jgi:hypothetical protein